MALQVITEQLAADLESQFAAIARNWRSIQDELRARPGLEISLQVGTAQFFLDKLGPWADRCLIEAKAAANKYDRILKAKMAAEEEHRNRRKSK